VTLAIPSRYLVISGSPIRLRQSAPSIPTSYYGWPNKCCLISDIVVDGAAWHQAHLSEKFNNVSIIKLPPYSPELNPIEQVWQWLRQNELANRCFSGYKNIVDEYSRAWNVFISDVSRVIKLCSRDWIKVGS